MTTTPSLIIHTLPLGPMENLVYIIADPSTQKCAIIDPGWDATAILNHINTHHYHLDKILLTHAHYDHVNALHSLLELLKTPNYISLNSQNPLPIYVSSKETPVLLDALNTVPTIKTTHNDIIPLGNISIQCLETPGHTPGGQCFYVAPHLFTGDTLFINACGRCDFEYSNMSQMFTSLSQVIGALPDDTIIYPGHHYGPTPTDTLINQKKTNPYIKSTHPEKFERLRSGF